MFHNGSSVGRGISRLRFMAEKTVESVQVSTLDREHMLEQRYHQIDQVSELMKTRSCMRTAILEYFQGPKTSRRPSISVWILGWAFGNRTKSRRFQAIAIRRKSDAAGWRGTLLGLLLARFTGPMQSRRLC